MDTLISLIVDLINALLDRSKKDEGNSSPPVNRPDPSRPRPPARSTSWEEELRRLLEGQNPGPPVAAPPHPPPVVAPQMPRVVSTVTTPPRLPAAPPVPAYAPRPRPVQLVEAAESSVEISARELAPLSQSQQAYARASQLDQLAAAHIARVPGQHVQNTRVIRRQDSPEVTEVISLFKNARTARQAVLISAVFGPPRALEEQNVTNF